MVKHYKISKKDKIFNNENINVYPFGEVDGMLVAAVSAKTEDDFTTFEEIAGATPVIFEDIRDIIEESHLNKELNRIISRKIREKYSIDDEIALLKKPLDDPKRQAYDKFVESIKEEIRVKKIAYGIYTE